jgi:16S rRNA (cytidine1402-2'-O)-methyltransferase
MKNEPGTLYIVATPIGNLADITYRAVDCLKQVDVIACEDTRHSRVLLNHYAIATPMCSLHEHNEDAETTRLIQSLLAGQSIALISDAGTPLINDPGYRLVSEAAKAGIRVCPLPGPCAVIAALSAAGLNTHQFSFLGFPPTKSAARQAVFKALLTETKTAIFYESPHRLMDCLADIAATLGPQRPIVVAKELTKHFENMLRGSVYDVISQLTADPDLQRGEFVLLIEGLSADALPSNDYHSLLTHLLTALPLKEAVSLTAKITGAKRNEIYKAALEQRG